MATKKKVVHPKMDPNLIAVKQTWELDYVVQKMKGEGIKVTREDVRKAAKVHRGSRKRVYNTLRGK